MLDGTTVSAAFGGAVDRERFIEYLSVQLPPAPHPGDMVVMDILAPHKAHGADGNLSVMPGQPFFTSRRTAPASTRSNRRGQK